MKISAFIVAYNEERHIERCLKSLVSAVDEIILVHDGECRDKTLEIAKRYKVKTFVEQHKGLRELHQIFALKQCKYEWVLQIDADEFLSKELHQQIKKLVQDKDVDGYSFVWKLWDGKKYITQNTPHKNILFRKSKMYYFAFPGKDSGTYGNLLKSSLVLEHKPLYNNYTLNKFNTKWKKWIKVHAQFFYNQKFEHYNCTPEILESFNQSIVKQKKYAKPYFAPAWILQSIVVSMFRHNYWKSFRTWKVAFLQGLYGFYLCLYIWKYRK